MKFMPLKPIKFTPIEKHKVRRVTTRKTLALKSETDSLKVYSTECMLRNSIKVNLMKVKGGESLFIYHFLFLVIASFQAAAGSQKSCFKNVDIGFVMDSSDSTSSQEYQHQKELVQRLSAYYDISRENTRAGVIVYSDKAFTTAGLNSYKDSSVFQRAVGALPRLNGGNRKDNALITARRLFKTRRPQSLAGSAKASQVLVFITEGAQSSAANMLPLERAVHPLRKHGVRIVVVGVGRQVVYRELRSIAQDAGDIYLASSLDDVDKVARDLIKVICKVK